MLGQWFVEIGGFGAEGIGEGAEVFDGAVDAVAWLEVVSCGDGDAGGRAGCDDVAGFERHYIA